MNHGNVTLFIPHNGCPHQCSFCNQREITGQQKQPCAQDVRKAVEESCAHYPERVRHWEIAFFGGSFTAVDWAYQQELLEAAFPYVRDGKVKGIRLSTRPDAIDEFLLKRLKEYGVTSIELGAQSMRDVVLEKNLRGHTAKQVRDASRMIQKSGISLGLQMMTGLYGDDEEGAKETARLLAELQPDTVRIYPAIVLKDTLLGEWYQAGQYTPMPLENAVELCVDLLDFFEQKGIPVIRLGLHPSPELEKNYLAGPWHPAFRELCESRRFLRGLTCALEKNFLQGKYRVLVQPQWMSKAVGQKHANQLALRQLGYDVCFAGDESISPGCFVIQQIE